VPSLLGDPTSAKIRAAVLDRKPAISLKGSKIGPR